MTFSFKKFLPPHTSEDLPRLRTAPSADSACRPDLGVGRAPLSLLLGAFVLSSWLSTRGFFPATQALSSEAVLLRGLQAVFS